VKRAAPSKIWPPLITLWIVWGSTYMAIAVVGQEMPPYLSMGLRLLIAGIALGAGLVLFGGGFSVLRVSRDELAYAALMGSILLGFIIGNLAYAERYVPSGIAALLVAVMPLFIVLFRFRAGEHPSRLTLAGVAIGMAGLAYMLLPGGTDVKFGSSDLLVVFWSFTIIVGSFLWAFVSWKSAGWPMPRNALVATFYELLAGALFAIGVGALIGERWDFSVDAYSAGMWQALIWLIIASVVGYGSFSWLIQNAPMSLVATYAYINPLVAVLLGFLIIDEPITRDVVTGLIVVVGGVALVMSGERRRS
jgi:drug/metabolite transporter (DMT)-like permease